MDVGKAYKGWVPLLGVPALFLTAYLLAYTPFLMKAPICGVRFFLGIDCPGCGLTRAFVSLVHGHLRRSIDFNPFGVVIAVWLSYQFIRAFALVVIRAPIGHLLSENIRYRMLQAFVGTLMIQWIIKLSLILLY